MVKELTQRYVREIVKEATKRALRAMKEGDIQRLQEAANRLSDQGKEEMFKGAEEGVSKEIYEAKTKSDDLVKEMANTIQKNLAIPQIVVKGKADVPKPRSIFKGIFLGAVKLCILLVIATVAIWAYQYILYPSETGVTVEPEFIPHTGDIQVTLTWYANADIDLHVEDPYGSEVYYGNPNVDSGGKLDLDNKCDNFVMGKPENIYWPVGGAPAGTYRVSVKYFADCSTSGSSTGPVDWTVTTKVNGRSNTFRGTLYNVGDTQEVTTFQF